LTYGNYQTIRGKVFVSGGISSNLAADLSINAGTQGQGWGRNLYTGADVFKDNHDVTVHSKWVYTPTDVDKITFIGDYSNINNSMNGQKLARGQSPTQLLHGNTTCAGSMGHVCRRQSAVSEPELRGKFESRASIRRAERDEPDSLSKLLDLAVLGRRLYAGTTPDG